MITKRILYFLLIPLLLVFSCQGDKPKQESRKGALSSSGYGQTLELIKERGKVICGVNAHLPGFGFLSPDGKYAGLDVDFCRALSTAIFNTPDKVEYRPLTSKERFAALQTGEVDVLIRNTTWTLTRETELGANFGPVVFYDGQGMMVSKRSGVKTLKDLDGATIGVTTGTTTELNLADQMAANGLEYTPVVFETGDELYSAFNAGRVDAVTDDRSGLVSRQTTLSHPEESVILDLIMSKEPLAPMLRHGDDQWYDVVTWTIFATIAAEEHGITSQNVEEISKTSTDPRIRKLLGIEGNMGRKIGLTDDWALNIIKHVGNYGEIYKRNLGVNSVFNLPRGLNRQYMDGGVMYAPPFR